jgi:hypothetical protein
MEECATIEQPIVENAVHDRNSCPVSLVNSSITVSANDLRMVLSKLKSPAALSVLQRSVLHNTIATDKK